MHVTIPQGSSWPRPAVAQASRGWVVITGLTPLPVLVGGLFPRTINAWQRVVAMLVGGLVWAGAWWSAQRGQPLLTVVGPAALMGMLTLQGAGAFVASSSLIGVLVLATLAVMVALLTRHGYTWPAWTWGARPRRRQSSQRLMSRLTEVHRLGEFPTGASAPSPARFTAACRSPGPGQLIGRRWRTGRVSPPPRR